MEFIVHNIVVINWLLVNYTIYKNNLIRFFTTDYHRLTQIFDLHLADFANVSKILKALPKQPFSVFNVDLQRFQVFARRWKDVKKVLKALHMR